MAYGENANSSEGGKQPKGEFILRQKRWQPRRYNGWQAHLDSVNVREAVGHKSSRLDSRQLAPIVGLFIALNTVRLGINPAILQRMSFSVR